MPGNEVILTTCPRDCYDACGIAARTIRSIAALYVVNAHAYNGVEPMISALQKTAKSDE